MPFVLQQVVSILMPSKMQNQTRQNNNPFSNVRYPVKTKKVPCLEGEEGHGNTTEENTGAGAKGSSATSDNISGRGGRGSDDVRGGRSLAGGRGADDGAEGGNGAGSGGLVAGRAGSGSSSGNGRGLGGLGFLDGSGGSLGGGRSSDGQRLSGNSGSGGGNNNGGGIVRVGRAANDVEGERVLEDLLVGLQGDLDTVGVLSAKVRGDAPLVRTLGAVNAACGILVSTLLMVT